MFISFIFNYEKDNRPIVALNASKTLQIHTRYLNYRRPLYDV